MTHTPLPWKRADFNGEVDRYLVSACGILVADLGAETWEDYGTPTSKEVAANAALIDRAVNCHEDLVAILEAFVARVEIANKEGDPIMSAWLPDARAAIARARKE